MKLSDILWIFWLAILMYGVFALVLPSQRDLNEKQATLEQLQKEKAAMEKEMSDLIKETSELENNNPHRMTRVARETFTLCLPGEKIYKFPDKK